MIDLSRPSLDISPRWCFLYSFAAGFDRRDCSTYVGRLEQLIELQPWLDRCTTTDVTLSVRIDRSISVMISATLFVTCIRTCQDL